MNNDTFAKVSFKSDKNQITFIPVFCAFWSSLGCNGLENYPSEYFIFAAAFIPLFCASNRLAVNGPDSFH
tara:strand:+ start:208 stop:417 length:210 start_codon:yes stop_codon:yes gene_type:complete